MSNDVKIYSPYYEEVHCITNENERLPTPLALVGCLKEDGVQINKGDRYSHSVQWMGQ